MYESIPDKKAKKEHLTLWRLTIYMEESINMPSENSYSDSCIQNGFLI